MFFAPFDGDAGQGAEGIEIDWCFLPAATRNALMKVAWLRSSSNTPQMKSGSDFVDPLKGHRGSRDCWSRVFAILSPKIRFDEFSHCEELQYGYIAVVE